MAYTLLDPESEKNMKGSDMLFFLLFWQSCAKNLIGVKISLQNYLVGMLGDQHYKVKIIHAQCDVVKVINVNKIDNIFHCFVCRWALLSCLLCTRYTCAPALICVKYNKSLLASDKYLPSMFSSAKGSIMSSGSWSIYRVKIVSSFPQI